MIDARVWLLLAVVGCRADDRNSPAPSATGAVDIVAVPGGSESLNNVFLREMDRASRDGRDLLVYVGAEWCEPCRRFHEAAATGKLDERLPKLRLLELDHDRDQGRLLLVGCSSSLLPLFALPTREGRCSEDKRVMGSVKGDGAVDNLVPRLQELLAGAR